MGSAFSIGMVVIPLLILAAVLAFFRFLRRANAGWLWQTVGIVAITLGIGVGSVATSPHWLPMVKPYFQCGCLRNMDTLAKVCFLYSMDNCPNFPTHWSDTGVYCSPEDFLKCPHGPGKPGPTNLVDAWADYVLVTNMTTGYRSDSVVAYCRPGNHKGGTYVLFVDGSVAWIDRDDFDMLGCDVATNARTHYGNNNIGCKKHLKAIGDASRKYAMEHNDLLPQRWAPLTNYVTDVLIFRCPSRYRLDDRRVIADVLDAWTDVTGGDYILVTNLCAAPPPDMVYIYCNPGAHDGGTCVLFADGRVRFVKTGDFRKVGCDITNRSRSATGPSTLATKQPSRNHAQVRH